MQGNLCNTPILLSSTLAITYLGLLLLLYSYYDYCFCCCYYNCCYYCYFKYLYTIIILLYRLTA